MSRKAGLAALALWLATTAPAVAPAADAWSLSAGQPRVLLAVRTKQKYVKPPPEMEVFTPPAPRPPPRQRVREGPDEAPLWQLLREGSYAAVLDGVAQIQTRYPDWTPPEKLLALVQEGQARTQVEEAIRRGRADDVVEQARTKPELFSCDHVDHLWALAKAHATAGHPDDAAKVYVRVVKTCPKDADRLAALYEARSLLPRDAFVSLVSEDLALSSAAGRSGLAKIRYELKIEAIPLAYERKDYAGASSAAEAQSDEVVKRRDVATATLAGWSYYQLEQWDKVEQWLKRALTWRPDSLDANYLLALTRFRTGHLKEAKTVATALPRDDPRRRQLLGDIHLALAQRSYDAKNYPETFAQVSKAEEFGKSGLGVGRLRAWTRFNQGDYETAAKEFETLSSQYPDADLAEGLRQSKLHTGKGDQGPDEASLWALLREGKYAAVLDGVAQVRAKYPDWTPPEKLLTLVKEGQDRAQVEESIRVGQATDVIEQARTKPELFSCDHVDRLWALAKAHVALSHPDAAAEVYVRVVKTCPKDADRLAALYEARSLLPRDAFASLVGGDLTFQSATGRSGLAKIRYELKTQDVAAAYNRKDYAGASSAVEAQSDEVVKRRDVATATLGAWSYYQLEQWDKVERWLNRALTWRPDSPEANYLLALTQFRTGRLKEAKTAARALPRDDPRRRQLLGDIHLALAQRSYDAKNYPETMAQVSKAEEFGKSGLGVGRLRAWTRFNQGDYETAAKEFETLSGQYPDADLAEGLRQSKLHTGKGDQGPDEASLWALLREGKHAAVLDGVAQIKAKYPDWTPPEKLLTLAKEAQDRAQVEDAVRLGHADDVIEQARAKPELFSCEHVDRLWALAKAHVAVSHPDAAADVYVRVVKTCPKDVDRLAALYEARSLLPRDSFASLVGGDLSFQSATGRSGLVKIRYELKTQDIAAAYDRKDYAGASSAAEAQSDEVVKRRDVATATLGAWSYYQLEQWDKVEQWLKRALTWKPDSPEANYLLALTRFRTGRLREATTVAMALSADDPRRRELLGDIHLALAQRSYDAQDYVETIAQISKAEEFGKSGLEVGRLRAWTRFNQGDYETAAKEFEALSSQYPDADLAEGLRLSKTLTGKREQGPDEAPLWQLLREGKYAAVLDGVAKMQVKYPDWTPPEKLLALAQQGQARGHVEDAIRFGSARDVIEQARTKPELFSCDHVGHLWALAKAQAAVNHPDEAVEVYVRVVKTCPKDADRLAALYETRSLLPRDAFVALVSEDLNLSSAAGRSRLAKIRYDLKTQDIIAAYDRKDYAGASSAVEGQSDEVVKRRDVATATLGAWSYYQLGQWDKVEQWLKHVLAWQPDYPEASYLLALTQFLAGRLDEAASVATSLPEDDPRRRQLLGDIHLALAQRSYDARNYPETMTQISKAEELGKSGIELDRLRAWTRFNQGDYQTAAREFEGLYRQSPDADFAEGLLQSNLRAGQRDQVMLLGKKLGGTLGQRTTEVHTQELRENKLFVAASEVAAEDDPQATGLTSPRLSVYSALRHKQAGGGAADFDLFKVVMIEGTVYPAGTHELQLRLDGMRLRSGDLGDNAFLGRYSFQAPYVARPWIEERAWEPRLSWRYERETVTPFAEVGTTPLGAIISPRPTWRLGAHVVIPGGAIEGQLRGQPVRDSLLSYTGVVDPYSGDKWGRVTTAGGSFWGYWAPKRRLITSFRGIGERLYGQDVQTNTRLGAGATAGLAARFKGVDQLSIGPYLDLDRYEHNVGGTTFGHGGYFSPRLFVRYGIYADLLTAEMRRFMIKARVAAGLAYKETAFTDFLPLEPDGRRYLAEKETDLDYSAEVVAAVALGRHLQLGGAFSLRRSRIQSLSRAPGGTGSQRADYDDLTGLLVLRGSWEARSFLVSRDLPTAALSDMYTGTGWP